MHNERDNWIEGIRKWKFFKEKLLIGKINLLGMLRNVKK